jgi:ATP adenylyltransferase
MKTIFAPWRIKFIEDLRQRKGGCVFCELALPGDDRSRLVLHRGKNSYVMMNRYPYTCGHLLIIPYKHASSLDELGREEYAEMMYLCARSMGVISPIMNTDGFNCGFNFGRAAGAGIADHLHMHVVPRWCGDSNFLPVLGETRSIPEYLEDTYGRLEGEFKKISMEEGLR